MEWEITVRKADNGYLLMWEDESEDGSGLIKHTTVIEEKTDKELESMEEVLFAVKEFFGVYYSKHNKENLMVGIKKTEED